MVTRRNRYWLVGELHPSSFALVMATGIVSLAAHHHAWAFSSLLLFWLNLAMYFSLWGMTLLRILEFREKFRADFLDHSLGPGFFTMVAATGVLGAQSLIVGKHPLWALVFWCLTFSLWVCLTYAIFTALIVRESKPTIEEGLNGSWLLPIVATQSVTVLSGLLAPYFGSYRGELLLLALATWLFGGMLYIWVISLIFYRYTFFNFSPLDLTPPYWINMGAVAISTLGGTILIANAGESPFLPGILSFLKGFTLFFWATATWWIPMLVILGIWRHLYRGVPLVYNPLFWGAVFPLGMYSVCTYKLAELTSLPSMAALSEIFFFVALAAWMLTFIGMSRTVIGAVRDRLSESNERLAQSSTSPFQDMPAD